MHCVYLRACSNVLRLGVALGAAVPSTVATFSPLVDPEQAATATSKGARRHAAKTRFVMGAVQQPARNGTVTAPVTPL
jgi:hypothetical protein